MLFQSGMGVHDKRVVAKLGSGVWNVILEAVRDGDINGQKMRDIAQLLHTSVGGRHRMRVNYQRKDPDDAEMREVLSDWYNKEMHKLDNVAAVKELIKVFENHAVQLFPLASDLRAATPVFSASPPTNSTSDATKATPLNMELPDIIC